MFKKIAGCVVSLLVLISSLAAIHQQWGTDKANGIVDEANALIDLGAKYHNDARPKFNAFIENLPSFPDNRSELEVPARELGDMYARAADQYRQAAGKFAAASQQPIDPDVAAYFTHLSCKWTKRAELRELLRQYVLLAIDPAVRTFDDIQVRKAELDAQIIALTKEEEEANTAAMKIQADHPKKFKARPK